MFSGNVQESVSHLREAPDRLSRVVFPGVPLTGGGLALERASAQRYSRAADGGQALTDPE